MKRLAVLISNAGTGTNLQAIIEAMQSGRLQAEINAVISDTDDAYGLIRAKKAGIPSVVTLRKEDLMLRLKMIRPDFICLAGWKMEIPPQVVKEYRNKILNIHPGLVPETKDDVVTNPDGTRGLWNKHKLAEKAVQNFIDKHATYAGSSLHFLTQEFDFGPVLGRCFVKVKSGDTVETLYARLKKKENKLYVTMLMKLCK